MADQRDSIPLKTFLIDKNTSPVDRTSRSLLLLTLELDKQVDDLKFRIKQQFTDCRRYEDHLHSIFIHRGMHPLILH
jgi:hypothetical protein